MFLNHSKFVSISLKCLKRKQLYKQALIIIIVVVLLFVLNLVYWLWINSKLFALFCWSLNYIYSATNLSVKWSNQHLYNIQLPDLKNNCQLNDFVWLPPFHRQIGGTITKWFHFSIHSHFLHELWNEIEKFCCSTKELQRRAVVFRGMHKDCYLYGGNTKLFINLSYLIFSMRKSALSIFMVILYI